MNIRFNAIAPQIPRRRDKKKSSAASVVAQALAKARGTSNIAPLIITRLEEGADPKSGKSKLTAIFPNSVGEVPPRNDVSFLLEFPNLRSIFEDAFLKAGASRAPSSCAEMFRNLNRGFFAYLRISNLAQIGSEDIDDEVLRGFREWLLRPTSGKPLHPRTVGKSLGTVRLLLEGVETGQWAAEARRIAERVPFGIVGARRRIEPTPILPLDVLLMIMDSAEKEVLEIEARWRKGRELILKGREELASPARRLQKNMNDYADLATCLAEIDAMFPNTIPDLKAIARENKRLANAIQHIHTLGRISAFFQPNPRNLIPFVLLLAICTVFNPDTILTLEWSNINRNKEQAGAPAVEIVGIKGRASSDLVRLLDPSCGVSKSLSLHRVLECLEVICGRIRPVAHRAHADRLFIFVPERIGKTACSFGSYNWGNEPAITDITWRHNLQRFIKIHQLPHFSLGQLRPTIIDMVQMVDGGLEAAQKVGNHRSPTTTWTHYTSSGVRNRYRERIGQVIMLRERWVDTWGDIDPRRLEPGQDKGSATPGFICLDPFDSPRPNQQLGKLCTDYGACPSCPLSGARPNDATSVAYYTALEQAIFRSQPQMSAKTWLERWAPVLADLRALLTLVPRRVFEESRKVHIMLPLVG